MQSNLWLLLDDKLTFLHVWNPQVGERWQGDCWPLLVFLLLHHTYISIFGFVSYWRATFALEIAEYDRWFNWASAFFSLLYNVMHSFQGVDFVSVLQIVDGKKASHSVSLYASYNSIYTLSKHVLQPVCTKVHITHCINIYMFFLTMSGKKFASIIDVLPAYAFFPTVWEYMSKFWTRNNDQLAPRDMICS